MLSEKIREWITTYVDPRPHIELGIRSTEHYIAESINNNIDYKSIGFTANDVRLIKEKILKKLSHIPSNKIQLKFDNIVNKVLKEAFNKKTADSMLAHIDIENTETAILINTPILEVEEKKGGDYLVDQQDTFLGGNIHNQQTDEITYVI